MILIWVFLDLEISLSRSICLRANDTPVTLHLSYLAVYNNSEVP